MPQVGGSELQGAEQSKLRLVPSVYSIITRHTDTMMQKEGSRVAEHVESTLLRMHFCRTADLGKRVYQCSDCQEELTIYNSCGDRHCPQCSGARRRYWLENTLKLTDCHSTYFQVVFTLPGKLSSLALGNRKERRASHGLPPSVGVFTSMESAYLTEGFHQDTLQEFETFRALQALEWEVAMGLSEAEQ